MLLTEGIYGFKHFSHQYLYLSFPSGHANTIAALCYGLYLVWGRFRYLYLLIALAVLASRVIVGSHYPGDVIFGAWLAILVTELIRSGFEKKGLGLRRPSEPVPSNHQGKPAGSGSGSICLTGIRAEPWRRIAANILLLTAGNLIYAAGINSIIIPQHFLSGGVMGVALIAHYFIPLLNTGYAYLILNIPLFVLGWFSISRRFVLYSAYGTLSLSAITAFGHFGVLTIANPILAAILGGIVCGTGAGIALRSQGSAGGLDIVAIYLNKKFGLRIGNTTSMVSAMVLGAGAVFLNFEAALYSLIFVFTSGKTLDAVLTGFNQKKTVFIISDCYDDIATQILTKLNRGVTYLDGRGGYSGQEKKVILSVITLTELSKLKQMVFDIDPTAFVVVNDTLEVIGYRHGELQNY
ncbi:MAG: YitT family protein [Syntrophobacteraceae bacterium]